MGFFTKTDMNVLGDKVNDTYYHESTSKAREMADDIYAQIALKETDPDTRADLEYEFKKKTGFSKR